MKKLFLLSLAIATSLTFTQCKKSESLTNEVIQTQKSTNGLEGTTWSVISIKSNVRSVDINWTKKFPKFVFLQNTIQLKLGRDICDKQYQLENDVLSVSPLSTCVITSSDHSTLSDMFDGNFELYYSVDYPSLLTIKNSDGTEITLTKVISNSSTSEQTYLTTN